MKLPHPPRPVNLVPPEYSVVLDSTGVTIFAQSMAFAAEFPPCDHGRRIGDGHLSDDLGILEGVPRQAGRCRADSPTPAEPVSAQTGPPVLLASCNGLIWYSRSWAWIVFLPMGSCQLADATSLSVTCRPATRSVPLPAEHSVPGRAGEWFGRGTGRDFVMSHEDFRCYHATKRIGDVT